MRVLRPQCPPELAQPVPRAASRLSTQVRAALRRRSCQCDRRREV